MQKPLYCSLITLIIFSSCAKDKELKASLEVSTDAKTYHAGEAITFRFAGEPDNIVFYSGEPGHKYDAKSRTVADNDLQINFSTFVQWGLVYNNLKLLVSNNFNAVYDSVNIAKATWTDVSGLAAFSNGTDNFPSGTVSLKSYAGPSDTSLVFIAFRYVDADDPEKKIGQNRWIIRTFNANKVSPENISTNVATMSTAGWKQVNFLNSAAVWAVSTAQLVIYGGGQGQPANDDWVISKGFRIKEATPDKGVALKNISTVMNEYVYTYTKPGTYKVVFDVSSERYNGEDRSLKQMELTILP